MIQAGKEMFMGINYNYYSHEVYQKFVCFLQFVLCFLDFEINYSVWTYREEPDSEEGRL